MPTPKPTDDILWAESASPGDVVNPSAKRAGGWQFKDALPSNALNYLLRATGRFGAFAADKFSSAGWLTLGSTHARLEVVTDTATNTRWDFLGGSLVNEVRATLLNAGFLTLGTAGPQITSGTLAEIDIAADTPTSDDVTYTFDSTAVGGEAYVVANVLQAIRAVLAPNAPTIAGYASLTGDGSDTAAIDTQVGYNIGAPTIVVVGGRNCLRIPLASGVMTQGAITLSVRTNTSTRAMYATIVGVDAGPPNAILCCVEDELGADVLGTGALLSGQSIQVHIIAV